MKNILIILSIIILLASGCAVSKTGNADSVLSPDPTYEPPCSSDEIECDYNLDGEIEQGECCSELERCEWDDELMGNKCVSLSAEPTPEESPSTPVPKEPPGTPEPEPTIEEPSSTPENPTPTPGTCKPKVECEYHHNENPAKPDKIVRTNSDCSVTKTECANEEPYCATSREGTEEKECVPCLEDKHCGSKCTSYEVCEGEGCAPCESYVNGLCEIEMDARTKKISRTCNYEPQLVEEGTSVNWRLCYSGKCDQKNENLIPKASCLVEEDDCGTTCWLNKIKPMKPIDMFGKMRCATDYFAPGEDCGDEPCTMFTDSTGIQQAACGCSGLTDGGSLTVGSYEFGSTIPSNIKCLTGEALGVFTGNNNLDTLLSDAVEVCDRCVQDDEKIILNFVGHSCPGKQGLCFPVQISKVGLDLAYCESAVGQSELAELGNCADKVVLNGCNVGKGEEGLALRTCIANSMGLDLEKVVASEETTAITPDGSFCPISESVKSPETVQDVFNALADDYNSGMFVAEMWMN